MTQAQSSRPFRRRWPRRIGITLLVLVALLLVARFALSPVATWIINGKLAEMEGYHGHVDAVEIALWTGSIVVQNFQLQDRNQPDDPPVVKIPKATFTGALRPMFHGKIGGRAVVEDAEFNIIKRRQFDGPVDAMKEAEAELKESQQAAKRWQDVLMETVPLEMSHFELKNGQVRFRDLAHQPQVDVSLRQLHVVGTGLRTRPDPTGAPLEVNLQGVTTGDGQLQILVRADPMAKTPEFFSSFELKDLALPPFNTFLRAYTGTDVSQGQFDIYMEVMAKGGRYEGYVKPFFTDLDFENVNDDDKPMLQQAKEAVVGAVAGLLENEGSDKVATQTPFSGQFGQTDVGLWETVENLWTNAFIRALREGLQGQTPAD